MDRKLVSNLLGISEKSYYRWKENRAIFKLLEMYFSDENIQEFLETGKIEKFENIIFVMDKYSLQLQTTYLNSFAESQSLLHEPSMHDEFRDFYFSFLANFGKIDFPFNINILGIQSLLTHFLFQYQIKSIKENLREDKINEQLEDLKLEINEPISSSISEQDRNELEEFRENFQEDSLKDEIIEDIFFNNERNFEGIMLHFFTFNNWNNDMYYFLELVKKDEFNYFINSENDELLYQAIGYLVYSYYQNLNMPDKLALIHSTYHYFIANKNLISKENIKKHILDRVNNPKAFKEIDEKLFSDYINSPFSENLTNSFDIDFGNEEIETVTFEDLVKKGS